VPCNSCSPTNKGFTQVPNSVLRDPSLSPSHKMVYAVLLSYCHDPADRSCSIAHETIADQIGLSTGQVRRLCHDLRARGMISWTKGGDGQPNTYRVHRANSPAQPHASPAQNPSMPDQADEPDRASMHTLTDSEHPSTPDSADSDRAPMHTLNPDGDPDRASAISLPEADRASVITLNDEAVSDRASTRAIKYMMYDTHSNTDHSSSSYVADEISDRASMRELSERLALRLTSLGFVDAEQFISGHGPQRVAAWLEAMDASDQSAIRNPGAFLRTALLSGAPPRPVHAKPSDNEPQDKFIRGKYGHLVNY
jgi:hypothetical protein